MGTEAVRKFVYSLSDEEAHFLPYDWSINARPKQVEPEGNWFIWLIKSGRGFGKTRTGAEFIKDNVENNGYRRPAFAGRDAEDVRKIMIEGESGILSVYPDGQKPDFFPGLKKVEFKNGAVGDVFYGTEAEKARGPAHDIIWIDELCAMKYPEELFNNLVFGLRIGDRPKMLITSTPKPIRIIRKLLKRRGQDVFVTDGSTYENMDNLSGIFLQQIKERYEGTRLGRQEISGEVLDDNPNALWKRAWLDKGRVKEYPDLEQIMVAVDPQAANNEESSETGIVVVGRALGHYFVLEDLSIGGRPKEWATQAITGYNKYKADRIIGERNNGGDMVEATIRNVDANVSFRSVWASRGKVTRAEPISTLYERGLVHHVGSFTELEDQLCEWSPDMNSPDRLDALVWGISALMVQIEIKSLYEMLEEQGDPVLVDGPKIWDINPRD